MLRSDNYYEKFYWLIFLKCTFITCVRHDLELDGLQNPRPDRCPKLLSVQKFRGNYTMVDGIDSLIVAICKMVFTSIQCALGFGIDFPSITTVGPE